MMAGPPGRPIYRHSSRVPNKSLMSTIAVIALFMLAWGVFFAQRLSDPLFPDLGTGWSSPITYLLLLVGIAIVLFIVSIPLLFVPTNFMVTTTGIQTSYSAFTRVIRGYPKFVDYRDIDKIFPQFMPGTVSQVGSKGPDTFYSLIIIMRNGKRSEIPWGARGKPQVPKYLKQFRDLYLRCPDEFKKRWSDLPVLTPEQEKISKLMDQKGREEVMTKEQIVLMVLGLLDFLLIVLSLVSIGIFDVGPIFLGSVISLVVTLCPLPVIFIRANIIEKGVKRTKASRVILKAYSKGERIGIVGPDARPELIQDIVSYEPISQENIEKALKAFEKHNPVRNAVIGIFSGACIMVGALLFFVGFVHWTLLILAVLLVIIGVVGMFLGFVVFGVGNVELNTIHIEAVLADEVRLGKDILPKGYRSPKWILIRRGLQPVGDAEIDKIRRWTRFSGTQEIVIILALFMSGIIILLMLVPFIIIFEISEWIGILPVICEVITVPLAIVFIFKTTSSMRRLNKLVTWEKRSGIQILPNDLRARWEKWDAFRTSS